MGLKVGCSRALWVCPQEAQKKRESIPSRMGLGGTARVNLPLCPSPCPGGEERLWLDSPLPTTTGSFFVGAACPEALPSHLPCRALTVAQERSS